jgi:uncharacterized membrane protein YdbT with pleckstrin-like domain
VKRAGGGLLDTLAKHLALDAADVGRVLEIILLRTSARQGDKVVSYVASVLAPGEQVRHKARLHWLLWLRAWAALVFLGVIVVGIVIFVRDIIRLTTTEVALTDRRLIKKTGLFARHARELELTSVEAVNVDQSVFGRLFDYGRVEVHGTGDDVWVTPTIANPLAFRRELEAASSALRAAPAKAAANL